MAVRYYEQQVQSQLKGKRKLSAFLQETIRSHRSELTSADLTYIFCDDDYLLEINQQFLNHDTLTDIITFDLSEDEKHLQGEIYISVDRIRENAEKFGEPYEKELHRVIFHGALHLCGFKDKTPADKKEMRQQEDVCLNRYFTT